MKGDDNIVSFRFISNKRGLSPVIASILLLSLVVVLAGVIFLWAKGFISEQIEKFDTPIENICRDIDFSALLVEESGRQSLEVINEGNTPISAFEIKITSGGNSKVTPYALKVSGGQSNFRDIDLGHVKPDDNVIIYPVLLGSVSGKDKNQYFACADNYKTL